MFVENISYTDRTFGNSVRISESEEFCIKENDKSQFAQSGLIVFFHGLLFEPS